MYQFSLDWFILQFAVAIEKAESADSRDERFENLFNSYIGLLYDLVCRSLFGAHKLLYSLLLTFKVQETDKELDSVAMLALLTGLPGNHPEEKPENSDWLTLCPGTASRICRSSAVLSTASSRISRAASMSGRTCLMKSYPLTLIGPTCSI
jgi:hypothetical protein